MKLVAREQRKMNAENVATEMPMMSEPRDRQGERDEEECEGKALHQAQLGIGELEIGLHGGRYGCKALPVGQVERAHQRQQQKQPGAVAARECNGLRRRDGVRRIGSDLLGHVPSLFEDEGAGRGTCQTNMPVRVRAAAPPPRARH